MSSGKVAAHDRARVIRDAAEAAGGQLDSEAIDAVEPRAIQQLMSAAVKLYIAKRESGHDFDPVAAGDLTATEVTETALGLLRAARLEPFELGWWRKLGQL